MTRPNQVVSVLLVDDHAVVREGYRRLLERSRRLRVVGEAATSAEALQRDSEFSPDVTVLDIALPDVSGIEILRRIVARRPAARVLMFSMYQDSIFARRAREAGARGYLSKNSAPDLLVDAVRAVADGRYYFSPELEGAARPPTSSLPALAEPLSARELEVLGLLARGDHIDEIAVTLGVSSKTVANQQSAIKNKLGVTTAVQLIVAARQLGLV